MSSANEQHVFHCYTCGWTRNHNLESVGTGEDERWKYAPVDGQAFHHLEYPNHSMVFIRVAEAQPFAKDCEAADVLTITEYALGRAYLKGMQSGMESAKRRLRDALERNGLV